MVNSVTFCSFVVTVIWVWGENTIIQVWARLMDRYKDGLIESGGGEDIRTSILTDVPRIRHCQ